MNGRSGPTLRDRDRQVKKRPRRRVDLDAARAVALPTAVSGPSDNDPPGGGGEDRTFDGGPVRLRRTPREPQFERGEVLDDRYQVEKLIGQGATGSVIQVYDRVVRAVDAMKILRPELAADPRWVERLGGELRYARRLQHPNVCRVFDVGEADGFHFLTMEFAAGGSLRQRLVAGGARTLEERIADARAVIE